jgi:PII-like signaling protein
LQEDNLHIEGQAKVLAIFIGESDNWHGKPLYAAIVEQARQHGLAGATVQRGIMGFGCNSRIHTASILRLSEDLPIVITIVDTAERIETFTTKLNEMVSEGLVATWDANVEIYRHSQKELH